MMMNYLLMPYVIVIWVCSVIILAFFTNRCFRVVLHKLLALFTIRCFRVVLHNPYPFIKLSLQSGYNIITIIIGGLIVTIPGSYLPVIKNFGIGLLLGIPTLALGNIAVYMVTGNVVLDDLNSQLNLVLTEADRLLNQLNLFINQFHTFVNQTGINVVTNVQGEMGIDVSNNLNDSIAQQYANRINVLDGLIHNHIHNIESIIERITEIEEKLSELDENYKAQGSIYNDRLKVMIRLYGHYADN